MQHTQLLQFIEGKTYRTLLPSKDAKKEYGDDAICQKIYRNQQTIIFRIGQKDYIYQLMDSSIPDTEAAAGIEKGEIATVPLCQKVQDVPVNVVRSWDVIES